jgi:hypothetical protein
MAAMDYIMKLIGRTDERTIRFLLKRPPGPGPRAQELRDELKKTYPIGTQVCKDGLMLSFYAAAEEEVYLFQEKNEEVLNHYNWQLIKIKSAKVIEPDYHIHVRHMEAFNDNELIKLQQKTGAKEVRRVEVKGGQTLEVLLKFQHHSSFPPDIKKTLTSYQAYSPNHYLLAANFCSKCFYHFSQGPTRFCADHPQMQQPRKNNQAQMEQMNTQDKEDKGK